MTNGDTKYDEIRKTSISTVPRVVIATFVGIVLMWIFTHSYGLGIIQYSSIIAFGSILCISFVMISFISTVGYYLFDLANLFPDSRTSDGIPVSAARHPVFRKFIIREAING